ASARRSRNKGPSGSRRRERRRAARSRESAAWSDGGGGGRYDTCMSLYFELHRVNPEQRLIRRAAEVIRTGGVIAYPTDSCYALGCHIGDKDALERVRRIRQADRHHHFTLMCRDLTEIGRFARIDTWQFRLLKAGT